jgi:hypothetical protein
MPTPVAFGEIILRHRDWRGVTAISELRRSCFVRDMQLGGAIGSRAPEAWRSMLFVGLLQIPECLIQRCVTDLRVLATYVVVYIGV